MKKKSVTVLCLGIMILMYIGCAQQRDRETASESRITILLSNTDEWLFGPWQGTKNRYLVFLPLVEPSGNSALAEHWEHTPDYKTWTFHLRRDIKWHDGMPVTSHDIKFSKELLAHPNVLMVSPSISVKILDDFNFTITYQTPVGKPDHWGVYYPKHILEKLDINDVYEWDFWKQPIGNGPYIYVRHVPKVMTEFKANPEYYKGKPKIDQVILKFGSGRSLLTELLSGNVDAAKARLADIPKLNKDPRFRVYYQWQWWIRSIFWNHRSPLFRESIIRKALTMAINRLELARVLDYPENVPLFDGITTYSQQLKGELPTPLPFDPERAIQLLEEAGWFDENGNGIREKDGREFRFTALVEQDREAVFVQDQLRRVGIRMDIQALQWSLIQKRRKAGDFEAVFVRFQNELEPGSGHKSFLGKNSEIGYKNPEMIHLLGLVQNEMDPKERELIYKQIEPIFKSDLPITVLFPEPFTYIAHRRIRGLEDQPRPDPIWFLENLWIEEEEN